ncbi:hypothetical protein D3C77_783690 [compost metagenome]
MAPVSISRLPAEETVPWLLFRLLLAAVPVSAMRSSAAIRPALLSSWPVVIST